MTAALFAVPFVARVECVSGPCGLGKSWVIREWLRDLAGSVGGVFVYLVESFFFLRSNERGGSSNTRFLIMGGWDLDGCT